jgi:hypothetical protein
VEHQPQSLTTSSPYLHRAFFPNQGYKAGEKWWMTEAKDFRSWSGFGAQVWCKCNDTASDIIPWPIPDWDHWNDFQSRITILYQVKHI